MFYDINQEHSEIDASELSSGVYIAILESGYNVYVQKVLKM